MSPDFYCNECDVFDFSPHGEPDHTPIFSCSKCQSKHEAFRIWRGEDCPNREELRKVWLKTIERAGDSTLRLEQQLAAEALERKTCAAYINTIKWAEWGFPHTIFTIRTKNGYQLVCTDCKAVWSKE